MRALAPALCLALSLAGCGYAVMSAQAPFGAESLAVVPFAEYDAVGMSADLAQQLSQLLAAGGVTIVTSRAGADAVLSGEVVGASTSTNPIRDSASAVTFYYLNVSIQAHLFRGKKQVWTTRVDVSEPFLPASGALPTEATRREALRRLTSRAARELHDRLVLSGQS